MLTKPKEETLSERTRLRQEAKDGLKFAWNSIVVGAVVYTVLTVSPYLIDPNCSNSGYAPVTLSRCLPEDQVKGTDWKITHPNPFGEAVVVTRGKPIAHELPLFVFLGFLSAATISGLFSLGRLTLSGKP